MCGITGLFRPDSGNRGALIQIVASMTATLTHRGPDRDGISKETGLPEKWTLNGDGMLWRAPYGGRSAPVIMGNHLYVQNPVGRGAAEQERVMCLDPDTGKVIWEYKFNMFQSDAPAHRGPSRR